MRLFRALGLFLAGSGIISFMLTLAWLWDQGTHWPFYAFLTTLLGVVSWYCAGVE